MQTHVHGGHTCDRHGRPTDGRPTADRPTDRQPTDQPTNQPTDRPGLRTQVSNFEMAFGRQQTTKHRNRSGEGSYRRRLAKRRLRSPERNKVNKCERQSFERRIVWAEVKRKRSQILMGFRRHGRRSRVFNVQSCQLLEVCVLFPFFLVSKFDTLPNFCFTKFGLLMIPD